MAKMLIRLVLHDKSYNPEACQHSVQPTWGKVIWYSLEEKPHPFFMGAILPAVSWVLIPVKKSDTVIGLIEIGSEEIIDPQTRNDPLLFNQLVEPFEILATKISQTFETESQ